MIYLLLSAASALLGTVNRMGAATLLRPMLEPYAGKLDAVVLGCTHYVFLKDMIRDLLPERIAITDGNAGTARQLRRVLEREGLLNEDGPGNVELDTSGSERDLELMRKLLDNSEFRIQDS